jgi:hypothetical protein
MSLHEMPFSAPEGGSVKPNPLRLSYEHNDKNQRNKGGPKTEFEGHPAKSYDGKEAVSDNELQDVVIGNELGKRR